MWGKKGGPGQGLSPDNRPNTSFGEQNKTAQQYERDHPPKISFADLLVSLNALHNPDKIIAAEAHADIAFSSEALLPFFKEHLSDESVSCNEVVAILTLMVETMAYSREMGLAEVLLETEDLLRDFIERDNRALLRRKAESLLFGHNFLYVASREIQIEDRRRFSIVPINEEYLGVAGETGEVRYFIKKEAGKEEYRKADYIRLGDVPLIKVAGNQSKEKLQRTKEAQRDYLMFLDPYLFDEIERDYGFPIRELTMREQLWFMASLREYNKEDEEKVMNITRKFGIDGARSFLSVEYGNEVRQAIVDLAEKLPEDIIREIFSEYGKVVTVAQKEAANLVGTFFEEGKEEPVDQIKLERELLSRSHAVLLKFAQLANGENIDFRKIKEEIINTSADTILFASIFKAAFKGKKRVDFESIRGVMLESVYSDDISNEDIRVMENILRANWADNPAGLEAAYAGFEAGIDNSTTKWPILKKDGKILAFMRFDASEHSGKRPKKHAGSFNVHPAFRGSAIGMAMVYETMLIEAKESIMEFEADATAIVATAYIEDMGGVIIDMIHREESSGAIDLLICELDLELNKLLGTKNMTQEEILRADATDDSWELHKIDVKNNIAELFELVAKMKEKNAIATHYFANTNEQGIRYIVFEPLP